MKYYTPQEYANFMKIDRMTVYRWIREERIDVERTPGGRIKISELEVPAFMRNK